MGDLLSWKRALEELEFASDPELRRKLIDLLHQEINRGQLEAPGLSEKLNSLFLQTTDSSLSTEIKRLQNRLRSRKILGRDLLRLREPPLGDDECRQLWGDVNSLQKVYDRARKDGHEFEAKYELHEKIGEGGMSVVFRAVRKSDNADIAIKYLRKKFLNHPTTAARFQRECQLCQTFEHPNIIRFHEFGEHEGNAFLIMEYLPLGGLDGFIGNPGFTAEMSLAAIRQVSSALAYVHAQGVIHRDVKLSNLLVSKWQPDASGPADKRIQVKLTDFGLCKVVAGDGFTRVGTKMGTDFYSAPELLHDPADVDHRADIYSLGVSLYRLLSGGAFPDKDGTLFSEQNTQLPTGIDEIVRHCIEEDREKRLPSALELAERLSEMEEKCAAQSAKPK